MWPGHVRKLAGVINWTQGNARSSLESMHVWGQHPWRQAHDSFVSFAHTFRFWIVEMTTLPIAGALAATFAPSGWSVAATAWFAAGVSIAGAISFATLVYAFLWILASFPSRIRKIAHPDVPYVQRGKVRFRSGETEKEIAVRWVEPNAVLTCDPSEGVAAEMISNTRLRVKRLMNQDLREIVSWQLSDPLDG